MHIHLPATLLVFSSTIHASALPGLITDSSTTFGTATEASCDFAAFKKLAFDSTLTQWTNTFHSNSRPTCFQWCTDACTDSPDSYILNGANVNWKPACARHDFSWRNLKRLGQFNEDNKLTADQHLRDGMIELCGNHNGCVDAVKTLYFPAVRKSDEPASNHNVWNAKEGAGNTNCTVFPGCCSNHGDSKGCGPQTLPGQYKGDGSCVAK